MAAMRAASWWTMVGVASVLVGAMAVGLYAVRPFTFGPIGPDAAAPVIEFQRLLAGQRLEGYLSQTSKPLLTLVYGMARVVTGDWRSVSALAIVSYALFAALAALLAHRLAGRGAAAFAGVALALSPALLYDVTLAYGVSWAMLACTMAGLAVYRGQPRYGLAGLALAAGALARPEVLAVTAVALAWVLGANLLGRGGRVAMPQASAWLLALGLLAIPILAAHDWALKGDPLFWLNTAQNNSAGRASSPLHVIALVLRHALASPALLPLAAIAVVDLAVRRRWVATAIVTTVPVAVALFFIASGVRGTEISVRYLIPIDLGLVFAAGIGLGAVAAPRITHAIRRIVRPGPARVAIPLIVGAVLAVALAPSWLFADGTRANVASKRAKVANANQAFAALSTILAPVPAWRGIPVPPGAQTMVLIPPRLRAQGIVDLDLPLWAGTKSSPGMIKPDKGLPAPGTILYHDATDDKPNPAWKQVEVNVPTVVGGLRLVPLFVDEKAGIWIVRVEAATGPAMLLAPYARSVHDARVVPAS